MRILCTCVAEVSHFYPLVPVARALADAGHEVTFATHPTLAAAVEGAGFRHVAAGLALTSPEMADFWTEARTLDPAALRAFTWARGFAGLFASRMADDLVALPEAQAADVLLRDNTELGGCVAAERLGVPDAAISVLAAGLTPGAREWIAEPLATLRSAHGLPADTDMISPFRYLTLHQAPRDFLASVPLPTDEVIRPIPFDRQGDEYLPAWTDDLVGRPTVYATLGTVFNKRPDLFEAILVGLRDEPVNLVLTVGRDQDPAQFGPQPPNIHIERYIPQSLLFPRCDLVLTHGGSGTVMAALAYGLPLVVMPIGADQPDNAARCVALGVGQALEASGLTPDDIRAAVHAVLSDSSYRDAAERMQQEIRSLPGPEHAVTLLERLAG